MFAVSASSRSQLRQTLNSSIHCQSQKGELQERCCKWFNMLYSHTYRCPSDDCGSVKFTASSGT